jgi:hypothetical protein
MILSQGKRHRINISPREIFNPGNKMPQGQPNEKQ